MSKYPQRALAERNKTVQMKNSMEDKILRQKLESFSRERGYIDRELRRISLARESLVESLDRYTKQSKLMTKRLSLPCLVDERRKDSFADPIGGLRRHTVDIVEDFQRPFAECKQPLKPLGCVQEPALDSKKVAATPSNKVGIPSERKYRAPSPLLITSMETSRDILEFRCTSPVTASLIQSGIIPAQERPMLHSRQTSSNETPLRLPKIPGTPARKISTGQANPRDGMLATNLKSKFRQMGSVVMATAILRVANERRKEEVGKK